MCLVCMGVGVNGDAFRERVGLKPYVLPHNGKTVTIPARAFILWPDGNAGADLSVDQLNEIASHATAVLTSSVDFSVCIHAIQWQYGYKPNTISR